MAAAVVQETSPPINALRVDFGAQLEVTRAAVAFPMVCPAEGPDLDGLSGAAFVLAAVYQVVTEAHSRVLDAVDALWEFLVCSHRQWLRTAMVAFTLVLRRFRRRTKELPENPLRIR
jgi:hypothetical protein